MAKKEMIGRQRTANYEKSRYVVRRFAPALLVAAAVNMGCLAVDVSKVLPVGLASGAVLAVTLFVIRTFAEKKYPGSGPTAGGP